MKNKSYIGISLVILVFGIWAIPKIMESYEDNGIVKGDRLNVVTSHKESNLVKIGPAPKFNLTNQNNETITDFVKRYTRPSRHFES